MAKIIQAYKGLEISFDEAKHQLFVNGERNPWNITGITGIIDKSGVLMGWQERITREYLLNELIAGRVVNETEIKTATSLHRTEKTKAGTVGDTIHEYAEQFSLGLKPEIPEEEKARNGVLAFLKWIDEEKIKVSNPEEVLLSKKYGFWGIKDSDGKRGKENFVIDYKTSKGIYPDFRLQTSAYLFASQEMLGKKYVGYWIVKFGKEDGNFEPLFVPIKEAKLDFEAFLAAFTLKKRLKLIDTYGR